MRAVVLFATGAGKVLLSGNLMNGLLSPPRNGFCSEIGAVDTLSTGRFTLLFADL